jgi:hypothetical protein
MTRVLRTILIASLLLAAGACKTGKNTPTAAPSEEPSSTPTSQSLADFQLVGSAQHAFVGVGPGIDTTGTPQETSTPAPTNASTTTFGSPSEIGVMRVRLDDASDSLKTNCAAARDETINVFWTTATQFDTALLQTDLESALEGHTVGVIGRLFLNQSNGSDLIGEASASPSASPSATANPQCVLVADQIGTSTGTIPTAIPSQRTFRTARPTVRPTATATTAPTTSPTTAPSPSASSSPVPTAT